MAPRISPEKIRGMVINLRKSLRPFDLGNVFMSLNRSKLAEDVFLDFKIS